MAEALFCYILTNDYTASNLLRNKLHEHAIDKGNIQFIDNLQNLQSEAEQLPFVHPEKIMDELPDMAALLEQSANPISIKRGDVVEGVIVRIDQDEILVDIGLKSEGVLSTKELPANGYGSFHELHLNDKILVYIIQAETQDGHALLSLRRANAERQWRIAEEQYRNGELLKAKVIDYNKGGLIVDVAGIRGFVPISQFSISSAKKSRLAVRTRRRRRNCRA